ncbi:hypothetical protein Patl1_15917 [Pistacia atlantica]|uniref:Uncharacterized protein n=1 Tax=Pistacia atlantica TaxID=434234 RepID=A0ACC1B7G1_9ROSI|nr:hypothetical protein Patl1_15917 [Pistacia atlantica]
MIVTEESQRSITGSITSESSLESTVLYSSSSSQEQSRGKKNWNITCEHCNVKGHKKENCYRLIGYPPDFKFTKKKFTGTQSSQSSANTTSAPSTNHAEPNNSGSAAPVFSKEQYEEILKLLNKDPTTPTAEGMVNMAGIKCSLSSLGKKQSWILDTGASHHMSPCIDLLSDLATSHVSTSVRLPNGHMSKVSHIGSHYLASDQKLTNVLYILDFKFNLISVAKMTRDLSCYISFFPDFCILHDLFSGKVKGIGREAEGLYFLMPFKHHATPAMPPHPSAISKVFHVSAVPEDLPTLHNNCCSSSVELWHKRLSHVPILKLKYFPSIKFTQDDIKCVADCRICPLAKQVRLPFTSSQNRASHPFHLLHMDVWGPYAHPTVDHHRFFLTIVDDHTRITWIFLMKHKSETILHLRKFFSWSINHFLASSNLFDQIMGENSLTLLVMSCSHPWASSIKALASTPLNRMGWQNANTGTCWMWLGL